MELANRHRSAVTRRWFLRRSGMGDTRTPVRGGLGAVASTRQTVIHAGPDIGGPASEGRP